MTGDREDVNRLVSRVVGILVAHLGPDDDEPLDGGYWGAAEDIVAALRSEQGERTVADPEHLYGSGQLKHLVGKMHDDTRGHALCGFAWVYTLDAMSSRHREWLLSRPLCTHCARISGNMVRR